MSGRAGVGLALLGLLGCTASAPPPERTPAEEHATPVQATDDDDRVADDVEDADAAEDGAADRANDAVESDDGERRGTGEVIEGRASYYSDSLAGNRTANGERYDPRALPAASRELPFGTMLRVTRVDTGASVIVRVNDRGPFGRRTRVLDLSRAAAERLGMIRAGVVSVRAEVLEP